jgi:hypothetical protein
MRFRRSLPTSGFSPEGWAGVADDSPEWSATVVASWTAPWIDWGWVSAGSIVAALSAWFAIDRWAAGVVWAEALSGAVALWALWGVARVVAQARRRSTWAMTLDPNLLTLASGLPGSEPVVLERRRAGWLVADEISTDWHARRISLHDDQDLQVASFVGTMARLDVRAPGTPAGADLPRDLPLAVLLGAWWPHPARRMTRQGEAGIRLRWRDPDVAGFPGRERRSRLIWSLLYVPSAAFMLWAAVAEARGALSLLFAAAAVAIILWRIQVLRWRPEVNR